MLIGGGSQIFMGRKNLLLNGTFDNSTSWSLPSPWAVSGGLLTYNGSGSFPVCVGSTSEVLISGHSYTLVYDITQAASAPGFFALANMGASNGNVNLSTSVANGKILTWTYGKTVPDATLQIAANGSANISLDNLFLFDNNA